MEIQLHYLCTFEKGFNIETGEQIIMTFLTTTMHHYFILKWNI